MARTGDGCKSTFPAVDASEFGRRIRAARAYADLSRPKLAIQLGMSEGYVRDLENGKSVKELERRGLLERMVEITGMPAAFFTVDLESIAALDAERIRRAAELLGPQLLAAARALDQAQGQVPPGTDAQDHQGPGSEGGRG